MSLFLLISFVYPNGHHLRPDTFARDNLFVQLVQLLYTADTATNVLPSIHVFNSLTVHMAIVNCQSLRRHRFIRIASLVLTVSIVLSTMFLKQHSVFDVLTAFILCAVMWGLVYSPHAVRFSKRQKQTAAEKMKPGY